MKLSSLVLLFSCCWILSSCTATPEETGVHEKTGAYEEQGSFEKTEFQASSGRVISYLMMEPAEMNSGEQYPLVLALHGIGGRGQEDWEKNCYANAVLAEPAMREKHPCFVLAPTVGPQENWSGEPLLDVFDLIDALKEDLPVDPERVYVTGQSMGGFGTFQALMERPKLFAAAVPVCGGNDPARAGLISAIPLWAFHGTEDTLVPVTGSREMIAALREAGGEPKYTELPGVGHGAWGPAYDSAELWAWLFSQRRAKP